MTACLVDPQTLDVRTRLSPARGSGPPSAWQTPAGPDDTLWADLAGDDPAVAYRAGFALAVRGRLAARLAPAGPNQASRWRRLIADLSSTDDATREAAQLQLEHAGPAAAGEVRRALATHPRGKAEARLTDTSPAIPAEPTDDGLRLDRAAQATDWSGRPAISP